MKAQLLEWKRVTSSQLISQPTRNFWNQWCFQQFQATLIPDTLVSKAFRVVLSTLPSHTNTKHTGFKGFARDTWCCEGQDQLLQKAVLSTFPSHINTKHTQVSKAFEGDAAKGEATCFRERQRTELDPPSPWQRGRQHHNSENLLDAW